MPGRVSRIIQQLYAIDPSLISPLGQSALLRAYVTSFWILVGFGVIALPQVAPRHVLPGQRQYEQRYYLRTAISMVRFWECTWSALSGACSWGERLRRPGGACVDNPSFPNWLAGLVLAAPLAAAMSTVDSQLLVAVGAIVNDVYANLINRRINRAAGFTLGCSIAIGGIVFLCAFHPPELLVWLNLHAIAGLIATFLWPVLLGLYWKRANTAGAFASIIAGAGSYLLLSSQLFQR